MGITKLIGSGLRVVTTNIKRASLRRQLLERDDRLLADTGVSRWLLKTGLRAWPWRQEVAEGDRDLSRRDREQAVKELRAYSDAELADLGLRRGEIEYAVRYGRLGSDGDSRFAA